MDAEMVLRVARPTNNLAGISAMYAAGLGLEVLGRFEDHEGFDGVMLGQPGVAYHLEFTSHRGGGDPGRPAEDDLLVFYVPDEAAWRARSVAMERAGFRRVRSFNPYWDTGGATFEDTGGRRVVIQNASWRGAGSGALTGQ